MSDTPEQDKLRAWLQAERSSGGLVTVDVVFNPNAFFADAEARAKAINDFNDACKTATPWTDADWKEIDGHAIMEADAAE